LFCRTDVFVFIELIGICFLTLRGSFSYKARKRSGELVEGILEVLVLTTLVVFRHFLLQLHGDHDGEIVQQTVLEFNCKASL